ncbi:MAG: aldehyde dehydrogenase family protein [Hyphomonadaceae bacterium]|nr:aldehyde dehydrogenase family protein [Hyphomonadaceae bacterium]
MSSVKAAFERLRAGAPKMARTTAAERIAKLNKLWQAVLANLDEIDAAGSEEISMSGLGQMLPMKEEIAFIAANLESWMKPSEAGPTQGLMGRKGYTHWEPKGVVLHLATWNAPILISLSPAVEMIAAGNTVMIKPSELAPKSAEVVKKIVEEAFAPDEVAVVLGGPEVAQEALKMPFNHVCYVGGTRVGKLVMQAAAEHFAPVTLELGGKNPVILDKSADIADAAKKLAFARTIMAGQVCLAPDYILVPPAQRDELVSELSKQFTAMYDPNGGGVKTSADLPRIINTHHTRRIIGLIEDAKKKGAKVAYGGEYNEAERYIGPTILTDVTNEMDIAFEETFGPVFSVMTYDTKEDAVAEVAKRPKPLGLYVFAQEREAVDYFLNNTRSGSVAVNNAVTQANNPTLPFGGCNHSGIGRLGGQAGFQEFSNGRAVVEDPLNPAQSPPAFYPPFPAEAKMFLRAMLSS